MLSRKRNSFSASSPSLPNFSSTFIAEQRLRLTSIKLRNETYAMNNPVGYVDPLGLDDCPPNNASVPRRARAADDGSGCDNSGGDGGGEGGSGGGDTTGDGSGNSGDGSGNNGGDVIDMSGYTFSYTGGDRLIPIPAA
jgi:hypothetical protein